jgi:hypothetical protein
VNCTPSASNKLLLNFDEEPKTMGDFVIIGILESMVAA